ncbi:TPA: hypothetical protein ENS27_09140, partial [bacterium]|nr:hypothetical protein [bacterium]
MNILLTIQHILLFIILIFGTWKICGLRYLTIPSVFMIYYIGRIYIAAIFIYFNNPIEYALPYLLSVQISPVLFLIGLMIINYMMKFQRSEIKYYYRNPILSPLRSFGIRIIIAIGIILLVALIPIYIRQVKNIALFHLIAGDSTAAELMVMREG